jgi:hypothetical protein
MTASPIAPPPRVARLPPDAHGRPVPWFVAWIEGVPDFRVVARGKVAQAIAGRRCFICGEELGRWLTFPVGPMSVINQTAPEPPSHKDCALYAVRVCPFLVRPGKGRRETGLPQGHALTTHAPGHTLAHNPGLAALWTTREQQPFDGGSGDVLFRMGAPEEVSWFTEGRSAGRAEVLEALAAESARLRTLLSQTTDPEAREADLVALDHGYQEALLRVPP